MSARPRLVIAAMALAAAACGASPPAAPTATPKGAPDARDPAADRAALERFDAIEVAVLEELAAADPRLADRTGVTASPGVLAKLGTSAVLAEDANAFLRGSSLDIFSFRARVRELDAASSDLSKSTEALLNAAPRGAAVGRPALERELLGRLVAEETRRANDEAGLADSASDLVRALVATWAPPLASTDVGERDAWFAKRLGEIAAAIEAQKTFSYDLQDALDPLERLLDPTQFPKGTAQMVELRAFRRVGGSAVSPGHVDAGRLHALALAHLGIDVDAAVLGARFERTIRALEALVRQELGAAVANGAHEDDLVKDAAHVLFVTSPCAVTADSRVRSMKPPPERGAVCGAITLLDGAWSTDQRTAVLMAMHDATVVAQAVVGRPSSHELFTRLEDGVQAETETARQARPLIPLGVALAAELLTRDPSRMREHLTQWAAFGDAPLDIVERELFAKKQ